MIPRDYITEWREQAPWVDDAQVEQDLVISRVLIDIFSNETLHDALAFRGGTALFKLHLPAARYSEDIDLVQVRAEPAGPRKVKKLITRLISSMKTEFILLSR